MSVQRLRMRWWRVCLPAVVLSTALTGCSLTFKNPFKADKPPLMANYQEPVVDAEPPKKIKDPLSLKLRYAQWMEEIENYEAARTNYEIVLQERPEDVGAILGLARIDQVEGRFDVAETGFRKALSLDPKSAAAQNALGQYYVARGRLSEGLPWLNQAVTTDAANEAYRFQLAVALARSGDTTTAYSHFVQSVGEPTAHYNLGMICKSQGQYAQAEAHLLQALSRKPDFEPAQQALTQLRQQAQAGGTYAAQPRLGAPIQQAGHSRPGAHPAPRQQQVRTRR